jgi:methionyl aminopeptidase
MINIYSPEEIKKIGKSGAITSMAVDQLIKLAVPGVTTLELDSEAEKIIRSQGAEPSFMMEPGYRFTTCMQVNDMVVHGIPTIPTIQVKTTPYASPTGLKPDNKRKGAI